MGLPIKDTQKLHRSLLYNFLYEDDLKSMDLLLSMLENEIRLKKIRPKYTCMKSIKRSMARVLNYRKDKDLIIRTLTKLINDDVSRIEFAVYLEGYISGYNDDISANELERLSIYKLNIDEKKKTSILFHTSKDSDILEVKRQIENRLEEDGVKKDQVRRLSFTYCEKIIKKKVYNTNTYLDKQLVISNEDYEKIVAEENLLTIPELTNIYQKIFNVNLRTLSKLYKTSYWYGVNDRVLNRY